VARKALIATALCMSLYSHVVSCGTPISPRETVVNTAAANVKGELVETSRFEIEYGDDTIGFSPAGLEHQALGPRAFWVEEDGSVLVADSVHGRFVCLEHDDSDITVAHDDGVVDDSHPMFTPRDRGAGFPKTIKLGAQSGAVDFGEGSEHRVRLVFNRPLASLHIVGTDSRSRAFVLVEFFLAVGSVEVDRVMMVVSPQGLETTELRIDDVPSLPVAREFLVTPDGSLYRMLPLEDRVVFIRMEVK
jgi:hypothetical protein